VNDCFFERRPLGVQAVLIYFIPHLTGSKPPTSSLRETREDRWGTTARKGPIGSTNHQWGMKPPLMEVSLY